MRVVAMSVGIRNDLWIRVWIRAVGNDSWVLV